MKIKRNRTHTEKTLVGEADDRKRTIYEAMSSRGKKFIQKIGYENWNPFDEPRDPINLRTETTQRTAHELFREFLHSYDQKSVSTQFSRGVMEMAMGLINGDDRVLAMYEFSLWYRDLLEEEIDK